MRGPVLALGRWIGCAGTLPRAVPVAPASLVATLALAGCGSAAPTDLGSEPDLPTLFALQPLGPAPHPADNPPSTAKLELGRLLFFDPILSGERDVSCGTCHHPDFGFADGRKLAVGTGGAGLGPDRTLGVSALTGKPVPAVGRNTPTVLNAALNGNMDGLPDPRGLQFWDGRALGLEDQALRPLAARAEMRGDAYPAGLAVDSVVARLRGIPEYEARFARAFGGGAFEGSALDASRIARALAAYQRALVTRDAPFDRFAAGDDGALTEVQKRGLELFFTSARCSQCHLGPMFSDFTFRVLGVPQEGPGKAVISGDDTGREEHTGDPADRYAFRTPSLRNVELTAPYMHDGAFASLEEVVRFYDEGGRPRHPAVDDEMIDPELRRPLDLSDQDVAAIIAFLRSLTDPGRLLDPVLLRVPDEVPSGLDPVFGSASGR